MSALSIQVPFPVFQDRDGQPLDDGYIWIGQVNLDPQVNPINVYFDAALTIPAAQPIRTLGGYPSNSGTPARLYANSDYSIRVMNKNGSLVYSAPQATERYSSDLISFIGFNGQVGVISDIADADGSDWIGFDPAGSNSTPRSAQEKLRDSVNAADYGFETSATGAQNVVALTDAFADINSGEFRVLELPEGTFQLDAGLVLPSKTFVIRGQGSGLGGAGATILQFTHTDAADCIKFQAITDTAAVYFVGPILEGFMVLGNSSTGDGVELSIGDVADITIRDVYVRNVGGECFNLNDAFICRFENLRGSIGDNGVVMTRCNECTLSGTFDALRDNGVVMNQGRANRFDGNIDDVGVSGLGGSGVKLQSVSDSKFHFYFESKSANTARETARLDSLCINNDLRYYSTDRNVYSDEGVDNVIHGVVGDGVLDNKRIAINIPNSSFDERTLTNWGTSGVGFTAAAIVADSGKQWVSTIFTTAVGVTNLFSFSDASSLVYAPRFEVGEIINVQFRVKASREVRSQYAGTGEFLQFSPNGASASNMTNYYSRHYEFFSVSPTEKIVKMKFKVLQAGNFGFRIQAVNIVSDVRIYVTDIVFSKNIQPINQFTNIAGVNNGQRYCKGLIVGGSNSTADAGYICTAPGYATTTLWAATTAYSVGDQVVTSTGRVLLCTVAGTSGAVEPVPAASVVDGTVTWTFLELAATFSTIDRTP